MLIKRFMSFINEHPKIVSVLEVVVLYVVLMILFIYILNKDLSTAPTFIYDQF